MYRTNVYNVKVGLVKIFIFLIRCYQLLISSWTRGHCRFYPTCSDYSKEAFQHYGVIQGLYFTLCRLLRCHPFHQGGYDPIPKERLRKHGN